MAKRKSIPIPGLIIDIVTYQGQRHAMIRQKANGKLSVGEIVSILDHLSADLKAKMQAGKVKEAEEKAAVLPEEKPKGGKGVRKKIKEVNS